MMREPLSDRIPHVLRLYTSGKTRRTVNGDLHICPIGGWIDVGWNDAGGNAHPATILLTPDQADALASLLTERAMELRALRAPARYRGALAGGGE